MTCNYRVINVDTQFCTGPEIISKKKGPSLIQNYKHIIWPNRNGPLLEKNEGPSMSLTYMEI